jgi:acyl-homoserine-lactone acylase
LLHTAGHPRNNEKNKPSITALEENMRYKSVSLIVLACALAGQADAQPQGLEASITRTTYGIPHITAKNWKSIGYGVGYAYAQDNLCMLAEDFATVAGERSLHFGTKEKTSLGFDPLDNLAADTFFRSNLDLATLRRDSLKTSKIARDLSEGYVAGYNRLLRDLGPDRVPEACRGKAWVRPITTDDMLRLTEKNALRSGALVLAQAIAYAAPPQEAKAEKVAALTLPNTEASGLGSNGWAFGAETTANGRGLIVGNPHFPWSGPSRFYQLHITIPGVVDVMGATLAGSPLPTIGFNKDIAWTHTVSAARHTTVFELTLDPADPTGVLVAPRLALAAQRLPADSQPGLLNQLQVLDPADPAAAAELEPWLQQQIQLQPPAPVQVLPGSPREAIECASRILSEQPASGIMAGWLSSPAENSASV